MNLIVKNCNVVKPLQDNRCPP